MPVAEHPVHERTMIDDSFRYGCQKREFKPSYLARDGLIIETRRINGVVVNAAYYRMVNVEHTLTTSCKYDNQSDLACKGCKEAK